MDEITAAINWYNSQGAPRWWVQNWFAANYPQKLNEPAYQEALMGVSETGSQDFDPAKFEPRNISEWGRAFKANADQGDFVDVDGFRVDRNGIYTNEQGQAFQLASPYGWRALRMSDAIDNPLLTQGRKEKALAEFGNQATEDDEMEAFRFKTRVDQAFAARDAQPRTGSASPDAASRQRQQMDQRQQPGISKIMEEVMWETLPKSKVKTIQQRITPIEP